MRYCTKCVMLSTRPHLFFDEEGVCDACRSAEARDKIDWKSREVEWKTLVLGAKIQAKERGNAYDCIVPVSGGKDSSFQVLKCVEAGLRPLCISFEPTIPTDLGRRNLQNLTRWTDVIQFKKDREVYRKLGLWALENVGDNEWPNHCGIFTTPIRFAVQMNIPLVVWGENPQTEYGGTPESRQAQALDRRWLEEFGGLLGLRTSDAAEQLRLTPAQLAPYTYPSDEDLRRVGVRGVFLGWFFRWDARAQVEVVKQHGFEVRLKGELTPGTYVDYENLDDDVAVAWHDWLGYIKYGYGRASYHASIDIRNGRMMREEAVRLVRRYEGRWPGRLVAPFCGYLGIPPSKLIEICDEYTNPAIFEFERGKPKKIGLNPVLKRPVWAAPAEAA